jgi:hypothetical protein
MKLRLCNRVYCFKLYQQVNDFKNDEICEVMKISKIMLTNFHFFVQDFLELKKNQPYHNKLNSKNR